MGQGTAATKRSPAISADAWNSVRIEIPGGDVSEFGPLYYSDEVAEGYIVGPKARWRIGGGNSRDRRRRRRTAERV